MGASSRCFKWHPAVHDQQLVICTACGHHKACLECTTVQCVVPNLEDRNEMDDCLKSKNLNCYLLFSSAVDEGTASAWLV
jgi:hypothetical protein